jgi:hypothetical protein
MQNAFGVTILGVFLWLCALPVPLPADPAQWDIGYGRMAVTETLAKVCIGIRNSEECAAAIERYQAPRYKGRFKRIGRTLTITLENGKSVSLTSSPRETESGFKSYNYIEFIPRIGQHLVQVQYYEGGSFYLVDAKTGSKTEIGGVPILAPRGNLFACFHANLEIGSSIEIWRVTGSGFHREWLLEPIEWLPDNITWLNDETIRIDKTDVQSGSAGFEVFTRSGEKWKLSR